MGNGNISSTEAASANAHSALRGQRENKEHIKELDLVVAGLLDAVKYILREDTYTAEKKLKAATDKFHKMLEKD